MGRRERRAYKRMMQSDSRAVFCKKCGFKTLHYALPVEGKKRCMIVCEICHNIAGFSDKYEPYKLAEGYKDDN